MAYRITFLAVAALLLAGCTPNSTRDYESSARCTERGIPAGTPEFERCVREESTQRMMEQQRQEFEERKREEDFWRMQRF